MCGSGYHNAMMQTNNIRACTYPTQLFQSNLTELDPIKSSPVRRLVHLRTVACVLLHLASRPFKAQQAGTQQVWHTHGPNCRSYPPKLCLSSFDMVKSTAYLKQRIQVDDCSSSGGGSTSTRSSSEQASLSALANFTCSSWSALCATMWPMGRPRFPSSESSARSPCSSHRGHVWLHYA